MNLKRILLGGLLSVGTVAFVLGALIGLGSILTFGTTYNGNVVANVVVSKACVLASVSNTVIAFGSIAPGQTVGTQNVVTVTDTGNDGASILVAAGTGNTLNAVDGNSIWLGSSAANQIGVSNTVYSSSLNTAWGSATAVGTFSNPAATGITVSAPTQSTPSQSATVFFGMNVPSGTPADVYNANIVVEITCN